MDVIANAQAGSDKGDMSVSFDLTEAVTDKVVSGTDDVSRLVRTVMIKELSDTKDKGLDYYIPLNLIYIRIT